MKSAPAASYVSCDAELQGRFCGECGEMRAELRHVIIETTL